MTEYSSIIPYTGDGSRTRWQFSFAGGYISTDHVYVERNGNLTKATVSGTTVVITPAVPSGEKFYLRRITPSDELLVNYSDGAAITESNLDTSTEQALFVAAEASDSVTRTVSRAVLAPEGVTAPMIADVSGSDGKFIIVDSDGNLVPGDGAQTLSDVTSFTQGLLGATDSEAARAILGLVWPSVSGLVRGNSGAALTAATYDDLISLLGWTPAKGLQSYGEITVSADLTVTGDHAGHHLLISEPGVVLTFTDDDAVTSGGAVALSNISTGPVSLSFLGGSDATASLPAGASALYVSNGQGYWRELFSRPTNHNLAALSAIAASANTLLGFDASGAMGLTSVTDYGKNLLGTTSALALITGLPPAAINAMATRLGLGTAASHSADDFMPAGAITHGSNEHGYWRKYADGYIEQWGVQNSGDNGWSSAYSFPLAFTDFSSITMSFDPNAINPAAADGNGVGVRAIDTSTFQLGCADVPVGGYWKASGY